MEQATPFKSPSLDYRGIGELWGYASDDELRPVIDAQEHFPILRSEKFCRSFWTPRLTAVTHSDPFAPIIYQKPPEDFDTRWIKHHKAIQTAEDPLAYCIDHMDE